MKKSIFYFSFMAICSLLIFLYLNLPTKNTLLETLLYLVSEQGLLDLTLGLAIVLIYVFLSTNEVTMLDNGYLKKYSFKNFIVIVSLVAFGGLKTFWFIFVAILLAIIFNMIKLRSFKIGKLFFDFIPTFLSLLIMTYGYDLFWSTFFTTSFSTFPKVKFPSTFIIILFLSLLSFLGETFIYAAYRHFFKEKGRGLFKIFYQEYAWIFQYELWNVIFALLFYNTAGVFFYENMLFQPELDTESALFYTILSGSDPSSLPFLLEEVNEFYLKKLPEHFLHFLFWILVLLFMMYIPLRGWMNSFKTFIKYNKKNVSNVIQNMREGMLLLDQFGVIQDFNKASVELFTDFTPIQKGMTFEALLEKLKPFAKGEEDTIKKVLDIFYRRNAKNEIEVDLCLNENSKHLNLFITPEMNRFDQVVGSVVTIENVTVYRNTIKELRDTQEQLVLSEKMAVIGQLVAGIAHEINTPLAAIKGNLDVENRMLEKLKSDDATSVEKFQNIHHSMRDVNDEAMKRILNIVKGLRNFARLDESEQKWVDIHEGIESTILIVKNQHQGKIEFAKEFEALPFIKCYPQQLNQVFLNMIVNSMQAIRDRGFIKIKTYREDVFVHIKITDNGEGIPAEHIERIFDPGFTTKGVGVGTGLGLAICYNIVKKHHGSIEVKSIYGKGTSMTIKLPIEASR